VFGSDPWCRRLRYGIDLEPPKVRVDRFEEAIEIIRSLLDEDRTTFSGTHYTITDAPSDPPPVQDQLPILVGTSGPRMCRITARFAQEWNTWAAPELAVAKLNTFSAACEKVGVDVATKHTSVQALIVASTDQQKIDKALGGPMGDRTIAGSDEHIIDSLNQFGELGFDEVIIPDFTLGRSAEDRTAAFDRFMTDIAPHCGA